MDFSGIGKISGNLKPICKNKLNGLHGLIYSSVPLKFALVTFNFFVSMNSISSIICFTDLLQYICWNHIVGVVLFIWASYQQGKIAIQFAKLRQNKSGKILHIDLKLQNLKSVNLRENHLNC